tara:strand:- start:75 stop:611 length:537 start_codon:yes stop_codon:yes gene_type:complete
MFEYYLSLGSNLGDKESNLLGGINSLTSCSKYIVDSYLKIQEVSSIYESRPIPDSDHPYFFNITLKATSNLDPYELLKVIKSIEKDLGRNTKEINQPRIIDIDIIFAQKMGNNLLVKGKDNDEKLEIPHPRAHLRAFVLMPMIELDRDIVHPTINTTLKEILSKLSFQTIVKLHRINY